MKKLLLLLLLVPLVSFGQIILIKDKKNKNTEEINISEFSSVEVRWRTNLSSARIYGDQKLLGKINKKATLLKIEKNGQETSFLGKKIGKKRGFWIEYLDHCGFDLKDSSKSDAFISFDEEDKTNIQDISLLFSKKSSLVMNRANAIKQLKEAKELLELEIMTKEEYEELKKKLTPIIMGN